MLNRAYFNEFTAILPKDARSVVRALADKGVLGGVSLGRLYPDAPELGHALLVAASECTTPDDIETLGRVLEEVLA